MALPTYASSLISAVTRVQQNNEFPQYVIGGQKAASYALFKKSDTYDFTVWRSPVYNIGKNFDVLKVKFAVSGGITGSKEITPVLYFDNESSTSSATPINTTNYTSGTKLFSLSSMNFSNSVHGRHNFFLELQMTGTALSVVKLPIEIELEIT